MLCIISFSGHALIGNQVLVMHEENRVQKVLKNLVAALASGAAVFLYYNPSKTAHRKIRAHVEGSRAHFVEARGIFHTAVPEFVPSKCSTQQNPRKT